MPKTGQDSINAFVAVIVDMLTAFAATCISVWLRFDSALFQASLGRPENPYTRHFGIAVISVAATYFTLRYLKFYRRPQRGTFHSKIPRLLRGSGIITISLLVILAVVKNYYQASAGTVILFFPCFFILAALQKAILFAVEIKAAKKATATNSVIIIGTDSTAARLVHCFEQDPRLRIKVAGVLTALPGEAIDPKISNEKVLGTADDFISICGKVTNLVQVIVSSHSIDRKALYEIALECEKRMIRFNLVPDMFSIMTSAIEMDTVDDIPLLGIRRIPLDNFWNRVTKRIEDIIGAIFGLIISAPIILVCAILIKKESSGTVFYMQERCGYGRKTFKIYKLRSMKTNAESNTGAVFAEENDPRCTKIGKWMRSHNVDEFPQFWNVLCGDMSLVGPRPERPIFVEQFSSQINHYMRRHASKPGITGWAQIHGLRGNTSIEDRLGFDIWYLENWSLALDIKILLRTCFAMRNAY